MRRTRNHARAATACASLSTVALTVALTLTLTPASAREQAASPAPAPAAQAGTQAPAPAPTPAAPTAAATAKAPEAKKEDVASMDAILAALYDVISGPAGQPRDWERFRSLFAPGARLIPTGRQPDGQPVFRVLDPDGYIARASTALQNGFFEKEIARKVERFGGIAHVFSTYESRHKPEEAPFARGINSIQLYFDGTRWSIVSVYWQAERPDSPIPATYLEGAKNGNGAR